MEQILSVDGGKLWTCRRGKPDGKTILLCGGGPGCSDYLAPVSEMLEQDYSVIRFEQRGCGRSVCNCMECNGEGKFDLQTTLDDMERIRKFYQVSTWIVGGHSWGANLALAYGLKHPDCTESLIYMAGNGIHNDRHWSEEYHINRTKYGETAPPMDDFNTEVNRVGNETLRSFGRTPRFYKEISQLNIKTIFIMAEKDIRPSWPVEQLYHLMPNAKYVSIPKAEHYIWLFNREALEEALLSFLKE